MNFDTYARDSEAVNVILVHGLDSMGSKLWHTDSEKRIHWSTPSPEEFSGLKRLGNVREMKNGSEMALPAVVLNLLGSILLGHYSTIDRIRTAQEKDSLGQGDTGLFADAQRPGEEWHSGLAEILGRNNIDKFIQIISNPTPGMLLLGLITYGIGASTLYHLNHRDKYQDAMLAAGIVIGACLGIFANMEGQAILLRILPWAVLVALWLSEIGHRVHAARHVRSKTNEGLLP